MNIDIAELNLRQAKGVSLTRLELRLPVLERVLEWATARVEILASVIEPNSEAERIKRMHGEIESLVSRIKRSRDARVFTGKPFSPSDARHGPQIGKRPFSRIRKMGPPRGL